jgi:ankyrin repeat protein
MNMSQDQYKNFINCKDITQIKEYLKSGADIDYKDRHNDTLLSLAIFDKDLERIKFLMENGANPNLLLGDTTYLMLASISKNDMYELNRYVEKTPEDEAMCKKMIQLLVSLGANLECELYTGETTLSHIAHRGDLEMSKCLILLGANYHKIDFSDETSDLPSIKEQLIEFIENFELKIKLEKNINFYNKTKEHKL